MLKHNTDTEKMGVNQTIISLGWQHQLELVVQQDPCQACCTWSQTSWLKKSNLVFLNVHTDKCCTFF